MPDEPQATTKNIKTGATICGWIEPLTTPNSITVINSNTVPGSFSSKPCNHYFFP